jgi:RNA polymerase sigma factor for flagellar operon FliA
MGQPINEYQRTLDQERRDRLVVEHLPLVKHVIGRLIGDLPPGVDRENLEAAGALGLVEAAAKFDPTRTVQFKTYAFRRVRGAILDELRRNSPFPQQVLERIAIVRRACRDLPAPITVADLTRATGMTEDQVADTLAAMRLSRMISWEDLDRSETPGAAGQFDDPEHEMERQEQLELLASAIDSLPERQRLLLSLYYREDLRLKEISAVVGLSESRISRVLAATLFELREYLQARLEPSENLADNQLLAESRWD